MAWYQEQDWGPQPGRVWGPRLGRFARMLVKRFVAGPSGLHAVGACDKLLERFLGRGLGKGKWDHSSGST